MAKQLARSLAGQGRSDEAEPIAREAFDILLECQSLESGNTTEAFGRLIGIYAESKRPSRATEFAGSVFARLRDPSAPLRIINALTWPIVRRPDLDLQLYTETREMLLPCKDDAMVNAGTANTIGVAQFRAGRYEEAIDSLTRADALAVAEKHGEQPGNWAFIPMAHHRLHHHELAQTTADRLRELMEDSQNAQNSESQLFLREIETLLAGR